MVDHAVSARVTGRDVFYNTLSNYLGQLVVIGVGILLTPFVLHRLGPTVYGLWVLVGSIASYGSLLDLGIASAITKYTAQYRANREIEEFQSLIATALCLYVALGLLAILLAVAIALFFPYFFQVPPASERSAIWLTLLAGLGVGVAIPAALPMAIFRGFQRFDLVNLISIAGTLLSAGLTVGMLLGGGGVIGIMLAHLLTSLLMQAPTLWLIRRVAPELRIDLRRASRNRVQAVTAFSASLFVINLAGHLQSKTDEIVIARFLPLSMVAPYALARRFSEAAHILTQQFIKVLLPLASELHANHEDARLRSTYIVSTRLALVTFLPVGCTLLMLSRPLLTLWVGAAYAETNYLVLVLTIAGLIDISQWPAVSILTGMARHQPLAAIAIGSGLTNLALSLVLVQYLGILGVALGTLIPVAIECLGFVLPYALRIIDVRMSELLRAVMWPAMAPALPMIATLYLLQDTFAPTSLFSLATIAAVGLLVYGLGYLIIGASPTERKLYRTLLANGLGVAQVRFQNLMR